MGRASTSRFPFSLRFCGGIVDVGSGLLVDKGMKVVACRRQAQQKQQQKQQKKKQMRFCVAFCRVEDRRRLCAS
jgi:hypothetical protein